MIIVLFGGSWALDAVASSAIIIAPSLCVFGLLKAAAGEGMLYSQFASLIRTMYTAAAAAAAAEAHAFKNQY